MSPHNYVKIQVQCSSPTPPLQSLMKGYFHRVKFKLLSKIQFPPGLLKRYSAIPLCSDLLNLPQPVQGILSTAELRDVPSCVQAAEKNTSEWEWELCSSQEHQSSLQISLGNTAQVNQRINLGEQAQHVICSSSPGLEKELLGLRS